MKNKYVSDISTKRWWVYDIFGNIGWILYVVMAIISAFKHNKLPIKIITFIPCIFILVGIIELIIERIKKLDRVLTFSNLFFGFGSLFVGGILATIFSIVGTIKHFSGCHVICILGGILLMIFSGLLLFKYKKEK